MYNIFSENKRLSRVKNTILNDKRSFQGSLKRCVLSTITQPVRDTKGFYENQAVV